MTYNRLEIQKIQIKSEESQNKTVQFDQVQAQIEASISRKENQKSTEKSQNK